MRLFRLALSIDGNNPEALSVLGRITAFLSDDFDTAREMVDRAVALNPNAAMAWSHRGWTCQITGQPDEAIRSFERAIRLSPFDPWRFSTFTGMSFAFIGLGRFDEAVVAAKKAIRKNDNSSRIYLCLAAALAHLGREAEVRETVARLLELEPNFHISDWIKRKSDWIDRSGQGRSQLYIEGLRKAGLPE